MVARLALCQHAKHLAKGRSFIDALESQAPAWGAGCITLCDTGGRETKWGVRASAGANLNWTSGNEFTVVPVWYKLERAGNTFTASQSLDGITWFTVGSSTVAMASTYFVGLAVVSGATTFDSVTTM